MRWPARFETHRVELGHLLGAGKQFRHAAKRLPGEIEVQACGDDPVSCIGELRAQAGQFVVKELGLVDRYHRNVPRLTRHPRPDFRTAPHHDRRGFIRVMGSNGMGIPSRIGRGLEDHRGLFGDLRTPHTPQQFFGFAREHRAANHFESAFAVGEMCHGGDFCHNGEVSSEATFAAMLRRNLFIGLVLAVFALPASGQTWLNLAADTDLPWSFKGLMSVESRWSATGHASAFVDLDLGREVRKGSGWWADGQLRLLETHLGEGVYRPERRLAFRMLRKQALGVHGQIRIRGMYQHARALPARSHDTAWSPPPANEALRVRLAIARDIYMVSGGRRWRLEANGEWFWRRSAEANRFESTQLRVRLDLHWKPTERQSVFVGHQTEWALSPASSGSVGTLRVGGIWHCQ